MNSRKLIVHIRLVLASSLLAGCMVLATLRSDLTAAAPPASRPNILFILADDLGYGDLGCYGQKKMQTPNLDRLAAESLRFTSCYAGSTVCAPSRAALMTGLHTGHARIRGNAKVPLEPDDMTVAEVLHQAGYRTGLVGKWGLGLEGSTGEPNRQGFDYAYGYLDQTHAHDYYPTNLWRNGQPVLLERNQRGQKQEYSHDLFEKEALSFLDQSAGQPFFLYLALTIPHANNELKNKGMEVPDDAPYTHETWPQPEKNKAAMVTRMDTSVGRILRRLDDLKISKNTVVFFTSDNGPHKEGGNDPGFMQSSGPFRGIKRDLYEGGIRVPMLVRWPGKIRPGTTVFPWAFWDFLPTAASLASVTPPAGLDGISILPTLLGKRQKPHVFFYWEFHERGSKQAVRMGHWKAVRLSPGGPLELYDLRKDPGETTNVGALYPKIEARILGYLATARSESPSWPLKKAGER